MQTDTPGLPTTPFLAGRNQDTEEAALEAKESHKYLLAKSYFDTREFDRCAAVFLPPTTNVIPLASKAPTVKSKAGMMPQKMKGRARTSTSSFNGSNRTPKNPYPRMSQKALFLSLYAKYLAGEKRKDEESEMVLGPADGGMTINRELSDLARGLEGWFEERKNQGLEERGQGWLEYLYGIILLKGKNEQEAKQWLIRSVHLYPFHWGAWNELNDLLSNTEDVSSRAVLLNPLSILTQSLAQTSQHTTTTEHHDPHLPPLLQPRIVSSYGRDTPDAHRT